RLVAWDSERPDVELHEVRLDLLEVDRQAGRGQCPGEPPRARVILGEALDVVVERVQAGRGDDPGLPHRAPEEVLPSPRLRHQLRRAGEERAEGTAEPL